MARGKAKYRLEWADFDREPLNGVVEGPVWDDVRAIVEHLAGGGAGFVILAQDDARFIQAARAAEGLIVEHRDGKRGHFSLAEGAVTAAEAVALFRAWFDRPEAIAEHGDWEPLAV